MHFTKVAAIALVAVASPAASAPMGPNSSKEKTAGHVANGAAVLSGGFGAAAAGASRYAPHAAPPLAGISGGLGVTSGLAAGAAAHYGKDKNTDPHRLAEEGRAGRTGSSHELQPMNPGRPGGALRSSASSTHSSSGSSSGVLEGWHRPNAQGGAGVARPGSVASSHSSSSKSSGGVKLPSSHTGGTHSSSLGGTIEDIARHLRRREVVLRTWDEDMDEEDMDGEDLDD